MIDVVPNLLSLTRLALALVFPVIPEQWRLAVVVAAAVSDWLDGYVARRFDVRTASGHLIDAGADKLFVFSVLVTLVVSGVLQWWQMLLVIARDLAVIFVAAYVVMRRDWPAFRKLVPRLAGKLTTGLQFAFFVTVLVWKDSTFATVVFTVTAGLSVFAAVDYLIHFGRALRADA